jgi:hypothetical protein
MCPQGAGESLNQQTRDMRNETQEDQEANGETGHTGPSLATRAGTGLRGGVCADTESWSQFLSPDTHWSDGMCFKPPSLPSSLGNGNHSFALSQQVIPNAP